MKTMQ